MADLVGILRAGDDGLTAIELAVVVAVLAVLAAMVAGSVTGMNQSAREAALTTDRSEMQKAVDRWVGEQPSSRYPVSTTVIVDGDNIVASGATPATNGLPGVGSGLYARLAFADHFTNPEGTSKSFVPDYMPRVPKYGLDSPNPWVIDEKGTVQLLAPGTGIAPTPVPTATPTPTPTPTATATSTPTTTPTPTITPTPTPYPVWATRAPLLRGRYDLGAAAASNGRIYAIGGSSGPTVLASVEEYEPSTNTWTYKASMSTQRTGLGAAAASNGKIYAVGGFDYGPYVVVGTVEEYDPSMGTMGTWATKASMPTARVEHGVVAATNGKVYAIGGAYGGTILATVEEYDPLTNTWTTRASMPTARRGLAAVAAANGKVYAIGGRSNTQNYTGIVEEYDPATNTWATKASMPTARWLLAATTAASNGKVYAVGGMNDNYLATVEEYDPATNTWATRVSMTSQRARLGVAIAGNGKIYAVGGDGYVAGGFSNSIAINEEGGIP